MKIFLTASYFTPQEQEDHDFIIQALKDAGHEPISLLLLASDYELIDSSDEMQKKVFEMRLEAINSSDCVLAVLDGAIKKPGIAWTIGYAYGIKIPIFGYITPASQHATNKLMPVSSSMMHSFTAVTASIPALINILENHKG